MRVWESADDKFLDEAMDDLKRPFAIDRHVHGLRTAYWSSKVGFLLFFIAVLLEAVSPSPSHLLLIGCLGFVAAMGAVSETRMRSGLRLLRLVERLRDQAEERPSGGEERLPAQPPE